MRRRMAYNEQGHYWSPNLQHRIGREFGVRFLEKAMHVRPCDAMHVPALQRSTRKPGDVSAGEGTSRISSISNI